MATRDESGEHKLSPSLNPAARATGTANGTSVDTSGYDAVTAYASFGAWTNGSHTVTVEESATGSGSWSTVAAGNLIGAFAVVTDATTDNTVQEVAVINTKRYLRGVIVCAAGAAGSVNALNFLLGKPNMAPV